MTRTEDRRNAKAAAKLKQYEKSKFKANEFRGDPIRLPLGHVPARPTSPHPRHARKRAELRAQYLLGLKRDREVGINPIYSEKVRRDSPRHKTWLAAVRKWNATQGTSNAH